MRQIVDTNGNVTLAESYEPYGSVLNSSGTASSIFGYAGEQIDTTGLIYLRARYMNPTLGIFLARDPWSGDVVRSGSMNGWNYVEGDPINLSDPTGSQSSGYGIGYLGVCFDLHTLEQIGLGTNLGNFMTAQEAVDFCRAAYSKAYWAYVPIRGFDFESDLPKTAHDLFGWYVYDYRGNHQTDRLYFDANQPLTQELANSGEIDQVRVWYYTGQLDNAGVLEYVWNVGEQLQALIESAKYPEKVSESITMFMGSFWFQVVPLDTGNRLGFRIDNDTTLSSGTHIALRHETPQSLIVEDMISDNPSLKSKPIRQLIAEYPMIISILHNRTRDETGGQGGGNLYQTYFWSEEYDCAWAFHVFLGALEHSIQVWEWSDVQSKTSDPPDFPAQ